MQKKEKKLVQILFLLPVLIFVIGIILSLVTYHSSYNAVERYTAKYPNNDIPIVGNIYYPKHSVYEKAPAVVYMSGFMMQKDLDPRIPIEFCRRGFVVITVDMHGHGEMDGIFGPMAYFDGKNVIDYIFDYLSNEINTSQLAVVGHSAGGLGALSLNDSRVKTTVTWAAPVYYSTEIIEEFEKQFHLYNPEIDLADLSLIEELNESAPYTFINATNPMNLLAIHHVDDPIVNISHAMEIHNKTQCELLILNSTEKGYMVLNSIEGSAHGLVYDTVMVHTINWIETHLGLDTAPVTADYYYLSKTSMVAMTFSISGLIGSGFTIVFFFCKSFRSKEEDSELKLTPRGRKIVDRYNSDKNPVLKQLIPFLGITILFFIGFITSWGIIQTASKFKMNVLFLVPSIYLGLVLLPYLFIVKVKLRSNIKSILFGISSSVLLIGGFIMYTVGFRTLVLYPHYFVNFVYAVLMITPWIIISSIVLWKVLIPLLPDLIFNPLTRFSENTRNFIRKRIFRKPDFKFAEDLKQGIKLRWKIAYAVLIQFLFNYLVFRFVPFAINTIAVSILMIIAGIMTCIYYTMRRELTGIIIMNILVLSYFYSTCYWFFPNFA